MIACAKCQRQNEDHYKFCLGCGSPLAAQAPASPPAEESIACPQCASRILGGQRFCGSCGFRVPDEKASPPSEPAEAPAPVVEAPASTTAHGGQGITDEPDAAPEGDPSDAERSDADPSDAGSSMDEASVEDPSADDDALEPEAPEPELAIEPVVREPEPEPEAQVVGHLVMVNPDGSAGESYALKEGDNEIGRLTDASVFQRDEFLSPKHAVFRVREDGIEIEDLDSLNGVFYRTTGPVEISPGDILRLGQEVLRFEALKDVPVVPELDEPGLGSPAETVWGRVARISGPENAASTAFLLWKDEHTVGRERGDFTFPDDGFVSGLHARIFRQDGRVFVEDLKSSNGTYLKIKQTHVVAPGSLLLLGKQPFRVVLTT